MSLTKHIRRPDAMPQGDRYHFRCDCGYAGSISIFRGRKRLSPEQIREAAEKEWVAHVPPRERRTYLLLDTRPPADFQTLDEIKERLSENPHMPPKVVEAAAAKQFAEQQQTCGNFLMPEGTAVLLRETDNRDGTYWGRFAMTEDGPEDWLPVGEVRTSEGRVFRLG